jgi:hypothetical protein
MGYVYIVSSPRLLDTVKVGFWRGQPARLKSRYVTTYGKQLQIDLFETPAATQVEALFKRAFIGARCEGELFASEHRNHYRAWLEQACALSKSGIADVGMDTA